MRIQNNTGKNSGKTVGGTSRTQHRRTTDIRHCLFSRCDQRERVASRTVDQPAVGVGHAEYEDEEEEIKHTTSSVHSPRSSSLPSPSTARTPCGCGASSTAAATAVATPPVVS